MTSVMDFATMLAQMPSAGGARTETPRGGAPTLDAAWGVAPRYYGRTLDELRAGRAVTKVPDFPSEPVVRQERRVGSVAQLGDLSGAFVVGAPSFVYSGYSHLEALAEDCRMNPLLRYNGVGAGVGAAKNALLPLPAVNCMLVLLAERHHADVARRVGAPVRYDEAAVEELFRYDGTIEVAVGINPPLTATGALQRPSTGWGRDPMATVTKRGTALVKNLWGPGLRGGTRLHLKLQKYDPEALLDLPYNASPSESSAGRYVAALMRLAGRAPDAAGSRSKQWVYQFAPVQPAQPGYGSFTPAVADKTLVYADEFGRAQVARTYLVGVALHGTPGAMTPIEEVQAALGSRTGIPAGCVSVAQLSASNSLEIAAAA